jgi:hypothetical protein
MRLVLIETSGNQNYIFATNKQRENIGASELTYRAGTRFVLQAVNECGRQFDLSEDGYHLHHLSASQYLRQQLLDKDINPRFTGASNGDPEVEVIVATSGKALLLVGSEEIGKKIIHRVTETALCEAPGLTVYGAIGKPFGLGVTPVDELVKDVHKKHERLRSRLPGPDHRFLRLPFLQDCATSQFPAHKTDRLEERDLPQSAVASAKCDARDDGWKRMNDLTERLAPGVGLPKKADEMEKRFKGLDWLAVIHADGNGLGQIFLDFAENSDCRGAGQWRDYFDKLRNFSLALDVCSEQAYGEAVRKYKERYLEELEQCKRRFRRKLKEDEKEIPLLPLVLGGDDLTVICDGRYAVRFTHDFLTAFEAATGQDDLNDGLTDFGGIVPDIAGNVKKSGGIRRLSSCAGVAIIKPHFPFHAAYTLAEDLLQSAKKVKDIVKVPASALDYHILYDASGPDLKRIREHHHVDEHGATRLYARPYIVTPGAKLNGAGDDWVAKRMWAELENRVKVMCATDENDEDRRALPNSMLHELREGLFLGEEKADARMRLVRHRYQEQGFDKLLGDTEGPGSLFWKEKIEIRNVNRNGHATGFLDALDLVEFWK